MKQRTRKAAYLPADAARDIAYINRYAQKELTPEEVYVFSVILCDNEVDRDNERFTEESLRTLAQLFEGKTGLFDHSWSSKGQAARLYRTAVERADGQTQTGAGREILRGWAYMVRTAENAGLIAEIEGGIKKEVSVGCAIGKATCSICGARRDGADGADRCVHEKGALYNGIPCFWNLEAPTDAYEWSFVAVPAQVGAGVTKSADAAEAARAVAFLLDGGLALCSEQWEELRAALKALPASGAEAARRQALTLENAAIMAVFQKITE